MMEFKVGDKVRVIKNKDRYYSTKMQSFIGKVCTIAYVNDGYCKLVEDYKEWLWDNDMLEPIEEKNCDNCAKYEVSFMRCDICHRYNDFRHWQPKEPEQVLKEQAQKTADENFKKVIETEQQLFIENNIAKENEQNCDTCKHSYDCYDCSQCEDFDEWEENRWVEKEITIDYLDGHKEHLGKVINKAMIHENICHELTETYKKKNNDYGDSFAVLRNEYDNAILIRIFDKYNRLKTLKSGTQQQVNDESIRDSLLDLANYCIMEVVEMEVDKCK